MYGRTSVVKIPSVSKEARNSLILRQKNCDSTADLCTKKKCFVTRDFPTEFFIRFSEAEIERTYQVFV